MKTFKISFTAILFSAFTLFSISTQAEIIDSQNFEVLDNCPTASFSIINNGALAGTPINFSNQSTGATSYLWDFGDGNTSTTEHPSHVYEATGTYTVKLTVIGDGCTVEFIGTEEVFIY